MESQRNNFGWRNAFTLVELLIVIGLLGALATLVLSNLSTTRTEALDDGIVQKELSDIQSAFQRFVVDCVPRQSDYKLMTKYGLSVLMEYDASLGWSFDKWDSAKGKGWRGPYVQQESTATVDITDDDSNDIADNKAQPVAAGGAIATISVVCTPYVNDEDGQDGDYYRIIPNEDAETSGNITQLWVVFPSHSGQLPDNPQSIGLYSFKRRLILSNE